jgi:hypothetical protein
MLVHNTDLPKIFEDKYYLTPNFVGPNCLLVFTKLREKFFAFTIDRKKLSYNKNKVDPSKVDINYVSVGVDSEIYKGSIFDGTLVNNGGDTHFIISDVYSFKGKDYTGIDLDLKLFEIKTYLENSVPRLSALKSRDSRYTPLDLGVNALYELSDVNKFVNKVIPSYKDAKIRGICFYPKTSGTKLVFILGNERREEKGKTVSVIKKKSGSSDAHDDGSNHKFTQYKFVAMGDEPIHAVLEMSKTDTVDVYRLFSVEKVTRKGKQLWKRRKMGIAYIPTMDRSKWCRELMQKSKKDSVLVKCLFHSSKGKWEPLELNKDKKIPTEFNKINVGIVEISDSDDE